MTVAPASSRSGSGTTSAPWLVQIMPVSFTTIAGTWGIGQDAGEPFTQYLNNGFGAGPLQNDEVSWPVLLSAGTWQLQAWVIKAANVGIATFLLDGVSVATLDGYNGVQLNNQILTAAGIVVAADGKAALNMRMATKNGASSGYRFNLGFLALTRTA